jgi:hypothetical protein
VDVLDEIAERRIAEACARAGRATPLQMQAHYFERLLARLQSTEGTRT